MGLFTYVGSTMSNYNGYYVCFDLDEPASDDFIMSYAGFDIEVSVSWISTGRYFSNSGYCGALFLGVL